jgi:molybdopterin synthase catalytic subunit
MIHISSTPIDASQVLEAVADQRCGASLLFVGTTRAETNGNLTRELEYECYEPMARQELSALETEARQRWNILQCCIHHRTGVVGVGEASIAIAVSSPHRAEAFAAGQWLIDQIKCRVPIWKKDIGNDGCEAWQHPQTGSTIGSGRLVGRLGHTADELPK